MKLELTTAASTEDAATLSQGIVGFNRRAVPGLEEVEDEVKFFVFARQPDGRLIGGVRAACFWNTLHVELLWLSDESRGRGAGRRLLDMAEEFATGQGCDIGLVETTSWQARSFYEKCGYALVGTVANRPRGHATHYLQKALAPIQA